MLTGFKYICWGFLLNLFPYMLFGLPQAFHYIGYIFVFYGSYQLYREHNCRSFLLAAIAAGVLPLLLLCRLALDPGLSMFEEAVTLVLYTITYGSSTLLVYFLFCGAIKIFQSKRQFHQWIPVYEKKIRRLIIASAVNISSYLITNALGSPFPVFILFSVSSIYLFFLEVSAFYRLYKMAGKSKMKKKKRTS